MDGFRPHAGTHEQCAVSRVRNGQDHHGVAKDLSDAYTKLLQRNGFFPPGETENATTHKFATDYDITQLAKDSRRTDELLLEMRDLENALKATRAVARHSGNYWEDKVFRANFKDRGTPPGTARLSTTIERLIREKRKDLGLEVRPRKDPINISFENYTR